MREEIHVTVNGRPRVLNVEGARTLLECLRHDLDLTGTKYGCGEGQCGACCVLLDGQAVASCVLPVAAVADKQVTTIEGVAHDGALHPVQEAFLRHGAFQCGFCTPGMIVAAVALLQENPKPTEDQIKNALERHLCRCCTYPRIVDAVRDAAEGGSALRAPRSAFLASLGDESSGAGGAPPTQRPAPSAQRRERSDPSRLRIAEDGRVTVYTGKVEVGQGSRTELTQVAAEELRVPPDRIRMVMADTDLVPDDGGTSGSRTTPATVPQVRRAAAAAREMLRERAAARWGVPPGDLEAADGRVWDRAGGRSLAYGELATDQRLEANEDPPITAPEAWRVCGVSVPRVDGIALVTGAHRYTSDLCLPGMLYGKVVRPPTLLAKRLAADVADAEAMPGVAIVQDEHLLGVAAPGASEAERAAAAIRARWEVPAGPSSATLFDDLKARPVEGEGWQRRGETQEGSVEQGMATADQTLAATYTVAYIAHAPLEPRAAVAEWSDGKLTVWTGTQQPFGVREALAEAFQLPVEQVRVIVPDTGSAYGGKHRGDAALEAARLAKAAGKPAKLVWTREEEFTWAYFRPAGVIEIRSGVARDGALLAWEMTNYNSGGSALASPWYRVPNVRTLYQPCAGPLRTGSYRALAATANHFARESHLDEVAASLGMDPLTLRLRNLRDERLRAVLEATAAKFGWSERTPLPGRGFGLACGFEKGGYVATCAEVAVGPAGAWRVVRITEGFECGAILNPDNLRNQIEGAILQGLGGALSEEIRFENGQITNPNFSAYHVPRFNDVPEIEVVLIDRKDLPSAGGGETPLVCVAPAIANALFQATGRRVRRMPLGETV
jgi:isoquinoline 1-oxidoreductase